MRVLVLIHEYPPIGGGGGRVAQDLCLGLARCGHELTVLTAHFEGLPSDETAGGVRVVRVKSLRREPYKASFLAMGAYLQAGWYHGLRLVRAWKPDLIHVHFAVPAGALAWVLKRQTGVPYVLTAHLGDVPGGVPEKTGRWFRWVYPFTPPIWRGARSVVAVSEYTRRLAEQHYPVPIQVIPNGVDSDRPGAGQNPTRRSTSSCVRRQVRPPEKPLADHPHACPATPYPLALRDGRRWAVALGDGNRD